MDFEDIIYEKKDGLAWITINRPKVANACRGKTWDDLARALMDAGGDRTLSAIIITGAGERHFCAGDDQREGRTTFQYGMGNVQQLLRTVPHPVIAAVNGYAVGAGSWMHYFCDFTIAAEHAIFGQNGARVGSGVGGYVVTYLAQSIGQKRAREMWMFCRRYTAQEALSWGLVNKVVPLSQLHAEAEAWGKELQSLSPTCIKILRYSFNQAAEVASGLTSPSVLIAPDFHSGEESQEGRQAFREGRQPDFSRFRR